MVLLVRHSDRIGGREPVNLRGHDEVVLMQAFDLLRLQRDGGVAPTKANVRMVAHRLGQRADVINEGECLAEGPEAKCPLNADALVLERPVGDLARIAGRLRGSGGIPTRQGVQSFWARVSAIMLCF